nr:MAG TPA: hypothetical protein [Caudoviricetes sp.]
MRGRQLRKLDLSIIDGCVKLSLRNHHSNMVVA